MDAETRLGTGDLADLFGLSPHATYFRTRGRDFPEPTEVLANGRRLWRYADIVAYARDRCARMDERDEVRAIAEGRRP